MKPNYNKIRIVFNLNSVVNLVTNISSEIFIFSKDKASEIKELIQSMSFENRNISDKDFTLITISAQEHLDYYHLIKNENLSKQELELKMVEKFPQDLFLCREIVYDPDSIRYYNAIKPGNIVFHSESWDFTNDEDWETLINLSEYYDRI